MGFEQPKRWWQSRRIWMVAALAALLAALRIAGLADPSAVVPFLEAHPVSSPLVFVGIYAACSLGLLPTLPLNLAAGFLWGPVLGSVYSVVATTSAAAVSFLVGRHFSADFARRKASSPLWLRLQRDIVANDWKVVAFTRLNPVLPTGVVNYLYGLTLIPFRTYIWSTFVFITPGSIAFACLGHLAGGTTLQGTARDLLQTLLLLSAAITVFAVIRYALRARTQIFRALGRAEDAAPVPSDAEPGPTS